MLKPKFAGGHVDAEKAQRAAVQHLGTEVPTLGDKGMSTLSDAGSRFVVRSRPHIHHTHIHTPALGHARTHARAHCTAKEGAGSVEGVAHARRARVHTHTHTHTHTLCSGGWGSGDVRAGATCGI